MVHKFKHATLYNLGTKAQTSPCEKTLLEQMNYQKFCESGQVRPFMSKKRDITGRNHVSICFSYLLGCPPKNKTCFMSFMPLHVEAWDSTPRKIELKRETTDIYVSPILVFNQQ